MQVFDFPERTIKPDAAAFSPDGRWLAVAVRGRVFLADTSGGNVRTLWPDPDPFYSKGSGIGFTPDGRGVIVHHVLHPDAFIKVHDIKTGAVARDYALNGYEMCEPGPGGRTVYVAAKPRPGQAVVEIVRWDPLTGKSLPAFARSNWHIQHLAVSADEKWLAGANGHDVRLWNIGGKKPPSRATKQFRRVPALVTALAISSDGAYFATGVYEGLGAVIYVCKAQTGKWQKVCERERDTLRDVAFHPSRPVLAHRAGPTEVAFYDAASRTELKRFVWPVECVGIVAFAADGLRCASAGPGKVVVWDVDL